MSGVAHVRCFADPARPELGCELVELRLWSRPLFAAFCLRRGMPFSFGSVSDPEIRRCAYAGGCGRYDRRTDGATARKAMAADTRRAWAAFVGSADGFLRIPRAAMLLGGIGSARPAGRSGRWGR